MGSIRVLSEVLIGPENAGLISGGEWFKFGS
jgi:hypothetical protein